MMNHKDAGAYEKKAPSIQEWQKQQTPASVNASTTKNEKSISSDNVPREVLVVVSKTKEYVRAKHSLNTSDEVMDLLSEHLRTILDEASKRAMQDDRKTLMERDFRFR